MRTFIIPIIAGILFFVHHSYDSPVITLLASIALFAAVLQAVSHAETISHTIGEPFGTVVLALAITIIEVSIILSLMLQGGQEQATLARDTVFSAVMIILNGLVGVSLLIGGIKHLNQEFSLQGIRSALTVLAAISILTLFFPNFAQSIPGPYYSKTQLIFVAVVTLVLYGSFLFIQNFRHRSDFEVKNDLPEEVFHKPSRKTFITSLVLLPVNLVFVVLLAESLAKDLDKFINRIGAPKEVAGVIIATVILLPEAISAIKAAAKNQLQHSLNLSLGSALATIGLTIPIVSFYSLSTGMPLSLGISTKFMVLFFLSLFVLVLSLSTGRTSILQGIVLIIIFFTFILFTIVP